VAPIIKVVLAALFAAFLTVASGAVWSGLFVANIKIHSDIPWAAVVMAALIVLLWWLVPANRRASLFRTNPPPPNRFILALAAGAACILALAGLWIVFVVCTGARGNLADFSHLPKVTLLASLIMAALVGGIFEEVGFRGYFQGTLESYMPSMTAVLVCAIVMAPLHAATQGFVWQVIVFYLLADIAFGVSAALTDSVLPGSVVHVAGLFVFFAFIWPMDKARPVIAATGQDLWFWLHVAQTAVFGAIGIWLFMRLSEQSEMTRQGHGRAPN
jgi:membrane protease YdiL (CAAX protease family)